MVDQNEHDQMNGENQISELVNSSEREQELDAEELDSFSGAGLKTAITGWKEAALLTDDLATKWGAFKFGLKDNKSGRVRRVKEYAYTRVAAD